MGRLVIILKVNKVVNCAPNVKDEEGVIQIFNFIVIKMNLSYGNLIRYVRSVFDLMNISSHDEYNILISFQ